MKQILFDLVVGSTSFFENESIACGQQRLKKQKKKKKKKKEQKKERRGEHLAISLCVIFHS